MDGIIPKLMQTITQRRHEPVDRSYTATLLTAGVAKIGEKITEEAAELVEAALRDRTPDQSLQVVRESADLVYHLCVLLASQDLLWHDVESELARRFGTSGLAEKAARAEGDSTRPSST